MLIMRICSDKPSQNYVLCHDLTLKVKETRGSLRKEKTMIHGVIANLFEGNVGDCNGCSQGANRGNIVMGRLDTSGNVRASVALQNAVPNATYQINWKCVQANIVTLATDATGTGATFVDFNGGTTTHFALDMQTFNASGQIIDTIGSGGVNI